MRQLTFAAPVGPSLSWGTLESEPAGVSVSLPIIPRPRVLDSESLAVWDKWENLTPSQREKQLSDVGRSFEVAERERLEWTEQRETRRVFEVANRQERAAIFDKAPLKAAAWESAKARAECLQDVNPDDLPFPEIGDGVLDSETALDVTEKGSLYLGLCKTETGQCVPEKDIRERKEARETLIAQTLEIGKRLESVGVKAFRETPFSLWHYFVHSRQWEKIPAFRRIVFLPAVAQAVRMPMLSAVEAFLESHPLCRFWTFTSGKRVFMCDVRDRVKYLHRRLSELNAQPFMQSAGVEIVFRSTELGTPEVDELGNNVGKNAGRIVREDGKVTFHVHAHCVVYLRKGYVHRGQWSALCRRVNDWWGHTLDLGPDGQSGVIQNARECVKYVTKPGELLQLSAEELADLSRQLSRLKLAQPMGRLAEEISARRDAGLRLVTKRTAEGRIHVPVRDWNRSLDNRSAREKNMAEALKLSRQEGKVAQRIVARLLPAVGPSGVKEPRVIVMTQGELNEPALREHPLVASIILCSEDDFLAGLAIRVHTCTSTVAAVGEPEWVKIPDRPDKVTERQKKLLEAEVFG